MKAPAYIKEIIQRRDEMTEWTGDNDPIRGLALALSSRLWDYVTYDVIKANEVLPLIDELRKLNEVKK